MCCILAFEVDSSNYSRNELPLIDTTAWNNINGCRYALDKNVFDLFSQQFIKTYRMEFGSHSTKLSWITRFNTFFKLVNILRCATFFWNKKCIIGNKSFITLIFTPWHRFFLFGGPIVFCDLIVNIHLSTKVMAIFSDTKINIMPSFHLHDFWWSFPMQNILTFCIYPLCIWGRKAVSVICSKSGLNHS